MEESIANPWLEDFRGFGRLGTDDAYFSAAGQDSRTLVEFTSSATEPYAYFNDPYEQPTTMAFKGQERCPLPQVLELPDLPGEPLHQLPGWTQPSYHDWQPRSETESSSATTEIQEPWMMEMPSLYPLEMPSLFHPGNGFASVEVQQRSPTSHDSNELVAATRKATARKNRILLRQKSAPHQRSANPNGSASLRPTLKKTFSNKIPQELLLNTHLQSQGQNMDPLRFVLHKVLQPSDVNNLGRIIISKKEAEAHLPYLSLKEGIFITMEDFDTSDLWTFRYRFWPNIKSRMYLLESTGDFIRAHRLKKGDIVILWRNNLRGTYVIQAMVALPNSTGCESSTPSTDYRTDVIEEEEDIKGKTKA